MIALLIMIYGSFYFLFLLWFKAADFRMRNILGLMHQADGFRAGEPLVLFLLNL